MRVYHGITCWCKKISHVSVNYLIRVILQTEHIAKLFELYELLWALTQERIRESTDCVASGRQGSWRKRRWRLRGWMASPWQMGAPGHLPGTGSCTICLTPKLQERDQDEASELKTQTFETSRDPGKFLLIHFSPRYFPMFYHCSCLWSGVSQIQVLMYW